MQTAIGTVAEYNPFHNGHLYNLKQAISSADIKDNSVFIAVMSGDFVQRGEPALMNKHARAEAACRCGVNLVVELPLPWSIMSAEGFAEAGITLLNAMGVDSVCFGAENAAINELTAVADFIRDSNNIEAIKTILKEKPDLSFAEARELLVDRTLGLGHILSAPNNILAVEYIKAISKINDNISPIPVKRTGAGHDSQDDSNGYKSAGRIRDEIAGCIDENEWISYLPEASVAIVKHELSVYRCPVLMHNLDSQLFSRLTMLDSADCCTLPDSEDGAGQRFYKAVRNTRNLSSLIDQCKTKRYTMARVKRMILCASLGITKEDARLTPPYIRILACDEKGRRYLHDMGNKFLLPVVSKPAHIWGMSEECRHYFELNSKAEDFYSLAYGPNAYYRFGDDYRHSPIFIKKMGDTDV